MGEKQVKIPARPGQRQGVEEVVLKRSSGELGTREGLLVSSWTVLFQLSVDLVTPSLSLSDF